MKFAAKYTPEQWAQARRLRAEGQSYSHIAAHLGFANPGVVSRRARKEGWLPGAGAKPAKARGPGLRNLAPAAARSRSVLVQRLFGFMDLELRTLELSMQKKLDAYETSSDAEPPSVTDKERASFAALIDNINKVTEMASEPALAADGSRKSAKLNPELTALSDDIDAAALDAASEKDNFRREIADQLEKLVPKP